MTILDFFQKPAVQIIGACLLPNVGGWAGAPITKGAIPDWYEKQLKKPDWRPANWIFAPAWTFLYSSMGYASYVVWKEGGGFSGEAKTALSLYAGQLALNWAWTPIFFGMKNIKWGFYEICALWGMAGATGYAFLQIDKVAGLLFLPYMAWLTFATALNYNIYKNNTPAIKKD